MLIDFLTQTFLKLFAVIDPPAALPLFVALTRNETKTHKKKTALKACVIAASLLVTFAFLGEKIFEWLEVTHPALKIAGGFLLLLAAIDMVLAKDSGFRSTTADESEEARHRDDISVFPLAIPLLAGPGALTTVVMLQRQAEDIHLFATGILIAMIAAVLIITYFMLRVGDRLMRYLGLIGTNVLTRVMGIIVAAMAVQFIIDGLSAVVKSFLV